MEVKIEESWKKILAEEFEKPYFAELVGFVKAAYRNGVVYPPPGKIFNAFNRTPFDKVKVVILGQDPYHEPGQAQGLAFYVPPEVTPPPSLVNIAKELGHMPDLLKWTDQGVLLLNATLTVAAHRAGSHQNKGCPRACRTPRASCLHSLGFICAEEGCVHRPQPPLRDCLAPSLASFRASRVLRLEAVFPRQRLSRIGGGSASRMVIAGNRGKGIACIVASAFGFALMAFFVRLCDDFGGEITCFQKSFFRNALAFVIALAVFCRDRRLVLRAVFGTVGIFANFYALSKIPIGEGMTLNKTAPFFTVLFSWIFLGERVSWRQFGHLLLAFAGAALVMKPGFRGGGTFAAAMALTGGLGAGLAYVCVHQLGRMKVNGAFIVLFFSAFSCLASLPFTAVDFRPMTFAQVLILVGAGAGAALGQFGVTAAYRYAEPRTIAVYDYTNVVFTALFGFVFFSQVPDALSVVGFLIILLAACAI